MIHFTKSNCCSELVILHYATTSPSNTCSSGMTPDIFLSHLHPLSLPRKVIYAKDLPFTSWQDQPLLPSFLHGSRCRTPRDGLVLRRSAVGMLINGSRSVRGDWWKIVIASLHWTAYSIEVLKGWDWNKWSRAVSWMGMLVVNDKFALIFFDCHYSRFSSLPIRTAMLL